MKTRNMKLNIYRLGIFRPLKEENLGVLAAIKYLFNVRPDLFKRTGRDCFEIYNYRVKLDVVLPWGVK